MMHFETLESRTHLTVTLDPILGQSYPAGKSIFVPVTGTTDSDTRVSYSASTDSSLVSARALSNLSFLRMNISIGGTQRGYLEFALFGEIAPNTVARITQLVNSGYYNNLAFHYVVPGFMAQAGDPENSGTGTTVDDEFHPDALFTTTGQLAMVNAGADTNDSQFFVTVDDTRTLDFRNTIFGQLVRGRTVLDQIMAVGTASGDNQGDTTQPVVITSAQIVTNNVDTVILVKGQSAATVTVKATDENSSSTQSFAATTFADAINDPAYLNHIPDQQTVSDMRLVIEASAVDIDSGAINIQAITSDQNQLAVTYSGNTITVVPVNGFTGVGRIRVGVERGTGWDIEDVNITVLPGPFAQYDPETRKLSINATSGNDSLQITQAGGDLDVMLNGKSYQFGLFAISTVNVNLGAGNDSMLVAEGITVPFAVVAGAGNDYIFAGDANDTVFGGDGDDILQGARGNDYLDCGPGNDISGGQAGWDTILGAAGRDTLKGGDNGDLIRGGGAMDSLLGGKGMDTIYGAGGNDTIDGQEGADSLYGGDHNDQITGGAKLDRIFGEAGNDRLFANDGEEDTVDGGDGTDDAQRDSLDVLLGIESGRTQLLA